MPVLIRLRPLRAVSINNEHNASSSSLIIKKSISDDIYIMTTSPSFPGSFDILYKARSVKCEMDMEMNTLSISV